LDANYRWFYNTTNQSNDGCSSCTGDACSQCTVDTQINYSGQGILTSTDQKTLTLKQGARLYLLDSTGGSYEELNLLSKEFSWDVDVSHLPCGMNGAMYTVEMNSDGAYPVPNPGAEGGASTGTGYCDAQCPSSGVGGANVNVCCAEMDYWEANRVAQATTTHACAINGTYICTGEACESMSIQGVCNGQGCDFNAYRNGVENFYGNWSGVTGVDSKRPFGVTLQFITDESNTLTEIRKIYRQDGRTIKEATVEIHGDQFDSITDEYCETEAHAYRASTFDLNSRPSCSHKPVGTVNYNKVGGLASMGESISRGHVLVLSLWNDPSCHMFWLDGKFGYGPGGERGPCGTSDESGPWADSEPNDVHVIFSNIRWGEIGSTSM
jgi:cellulose 1,4-beta-cellobiosidase